MSWDQRTSPALCGAERGLEMCLGLSRLHPSEEPGVDLVLQLDHPFCSPGPLVAPIINSRLGEGGLRNSDKSTSCLLSHLGQAARSWGPTLCPLPSLLLGCPWRPPWGRPGLGQDELHVRSITGSSAVSVPPCWLQRRSGK